MPLSLTNKTSKIQTWVCSNIDREIHTGVIAVFLDFFNVILGEH